MPRKVRRTRHRVVVAASMAVSAIVVVLLNLKLGDKKVDTVVDHLHGVEDEEFIRTMSAMPGPEVLTGNNVQTFVNGAEIVGPHARGGGSCSKPARKSTSISQPCSTVR